VVVGVLEAGLQGVVVDVGHAALGFHAGYVHGLELQVSHGAGGVLGKGLVDAQGYIGPGGGEFTAPNQVGLDEFLRQVQRHIKYLLLYLLFYRKEEEVSS